MEKKYFIQQYLDLEGEYFHGGIGCVDAERTLVRLGYLPILFPHASSFSLTAKINRFLFLLKMAINIEKGSTVLFIHPFYAAMPYRLVLLLRLLKNIKAICFIADIDGIKDGNTQLLKTELNFFKKWKHFLVHNASMKNWLFQYADQGSVIKCISFFDFLTPPVERPPVRGSDIVFAGNLEKSRFLNQLHLLTHNSGRDLHFHLYGPGITGSITGQANITWHGTYPPYHLPEVIRGSYGLLWDGDSTDSPGGHLGNYMQFITHHKVSLYILCGLPLIVPAFAGSAELILRYKIGVVIDDLQQIGEKINAITDEEYNQMVENTRPLAWRISQGRFLEDALNPP